MWVAADRLLVRTGSVWASALARRRYMPAPHTRRARNTPRCCASRFSSVQQLMVNRRYLVHLPVSVEMLADVGAGGSSQHIPELRVVHDVADSLGERLV